MADLNVTLGSKYPVLVGGVPASGADGFGADTTIITISQDTDGVFKLFPQAVGETDLTDTHEGEVVNPAHVIVGATPVDITLGDAEPA